MSWIARWLTGTPRKRQADDEDIQPPEGKKPRNLFTADDTTASKESVSARVVDTPVAAGFGALLTRLVLR